MSDLHFNVLNQIGATACCDAQLHGLWDDINALNDGNERHHCARLVADEAEETLLASSEPEHYREELADVVIMALSSAAYLGIDIGAEVQRKMLINQGRPYRHGRKE